jgi:hypothetical protein
MIKIITTKKQKNTNVPFEITTKVGKYTYIYQSTSYRDKNKQPKSKRTPIGKIINKQKIYKPQHNPQTKNTPQTVQKLAKIPEKQEKNCFSPSVYTKNTKNSSF